MPMRLVDSRLASTVAALGLLVVAAVTLHVEGRRWWCGLGDFGIWSADAWGPHNSQHLLDPYTFTHISHGLALWGALWVLARSWTPALRALGALAVETIWEVVENSAWAIDR